MQDDADFRERVEAVEAAHASRPALLSIAVPPTESIEAVRERLEKEHAEVERLGGATATLTQGAVERAHRVLREYDKPPENGLVVYTGVVDGTVTDIVFDDLPQPVQETTITRAKEFDLGPLEVAADEHDVYGLLVVERGGAALGRYDGESVTHLESFDSDVPGKHRAGGQSADRFERRRQERKAEFFERVADAARREFLDTGRDRVDGLVLGGTEITVDEFNDGGYLDTRLQESVVDTYSVEYANEQGLRQLAEQAANDLPVDHRAREALDDFFAALAHEDDPVAYGRDAVKRALRFDAVETLLLSAALPVETRLELEERAQEEGGESVIVPTGTDRGDRFADAFGGVAALCRFPIE